MCQKRPKGQKGLRMARRKVDHDSVGNSGLAGELLWLGNHADVLPGNVFLLEIRLKLGHTDVEEHMAVVKGDIDGVPVVGFITAPDLDTLVHLVAAKLANGTIKWREDRPYEQRK